MRRRSNVLNNPDLYGFNCTVENFEAFTHYWRVIGHMLGIHDRYNLFTDEREQNIVRLQLVSERLYREMLSAPDTDDFRFYIDTMGRGLAAFNPLITTDSFLYFTRMANGCEGYTHYWAGDASKLQALSWWDRWLLFCQMAVHRWLVPVAWTRLLLNVWIVMMFMLVTYAPVLAVWHFGWRNNFVKVMKHAKFR